MMKEKLIANLNRMINKLKNFPQILNRSHHLTLRKILLILVKDFLEMTEERRESMAKARARAKIKNIEDKIIREVTEKKVKRRARHRKESLKKNQKPIKIKDVRKDLGIAKTHLKNLKKLKNRNVNMKRKRRESSKEERNGWKSIKKIGKIKTIKRSLKNLHLKNKILYQKIKILHHKTKIKNKELVTQIEETDNRENVEREDREGPSVMTKKSRRKKICQKVLEILKEKNLILLLNNKRKKEKANKIKKMDSLKKEEINKDTEDLIKIERIEEEMMKCHLKMSSPLYKFKLWDRLQTLNQSHDNLSSIIY